MKNQRARSFNPYDLNSVKKTSLKINLSDNKVSSREKTKNPYSTVKDNSYRLK